MIVVFYISQRAIRRKQYILFSEFGKDIGRFKCEIPAICYTFNSSDNHLVFFWL